MKRLAVYKSIATHVFVSLVSFHLGTIKGAHVSFGDASSMIQPPRDRQGNRQELKSSDFSWTRVERNSFVEIFDVGVPWESGTDDRRKLQDVWIWNANIVSNTTKRGFTGVEESTAGCNVVKTILAGSRQPTEKVCFAIVDQLESYHIYKWIKGKSASSIRKDIPATAVWKPVSRHETPESDGKNLLANPPKPIATAVALSELARYLSIQDQVLDALRPVAARVSAFSKHSIMDNTLTVIVLNKGHVELLVNYVCSCRRLNIDLSSLLVIGMDKKSDRAAASLQLNSFYHPDLFSENSEQAAATYGSMEYARVMMAKVYGVHLLSSLGYNVLFHDVDIVPYRSDYQAHFVEQAKGLPEFDIYFQFDGGHQQEYAPWIANSGFYYVVNNVRTRYLWSMLVRMGDTIIRTKSHQKTLTTLMSEQASLNGLRIRVMHEEKENYPNGFQFHGNKVFMREMMEGRRTPYAFHMNYNDNVETKQKFSQQIGAWYVSKTCAIIMTTAAAISGDDMDCCMESPTPQCYFRDKPSKLRCDPNTPMIEGNESFW